MNTTEFYDRTPVREHLCSGCTRFAVFDCGSLDRRVLAISEFESIVKFGDAIQDGPTPIEDTCGAYAAYGSFIPQYGLGLGDSRLEISSTEDHWMRLLVGDAACIVGLQAVEQGDGIQQGPGGSFHIPVAMLILAERNVSMDALTPRDGVDSVLVMSKKMENLSPCSNLLNRPGIFAFDWIDTDFPYQRYDAEAVSGWRGQVSHRMMRHAALRIR